MSFDFSGFNELKNELEQSQKNLESLDGQDVPFSEMFPTTFMEKHTNYNDIDSFFEAGGFNVETNEEFEQIPESKLDSFVSANSEFNTWDEMLSLATDIYLDNIL